MRNSRHFIISYLFLLSLLAGLSGCSTSKNTASTRWWKGFKSQYNTYFNGHQAYLEGMAAKRTGIKDNYLHPLPLLMVGNESAKTIGSSNFETAITKCEKAIQIYSIRKKPVFKRGHKLSEKEKKLRQQTEYNPFLKNAWILMGMSQLQKGDFIDAASTFAYTARLYKTQSDVLNLARSLQAICYTEAEWYYDAENLLDKVRRDGTPKSCQRYYNMAWANLHLRKKEWKEAVPYLEKEVRHMRHGIEKARGYFLLAQVYKNLGRKKESYSALRKCIRQAPPYEMKFNAQVLQTEVIATGGNKRKISKLKSLSRKTNNKGYLDQIYYAIGNIYLADADTTKAIQAYESGRSLSTSANYAKNMLLVNLGDLYWNRERFSQAYNCYKETLGSLSHSYERYDTIKTRSQVLEKLSPFTDEIQLQDSLQSLTRMSEEERNKAIDRMIEMERKRQKEAEKARKDSIAEARAKNMQQSGSRNSTDKAETKKEKTSVSITSDTNTGKGTWYFYEPTTVQKGIELFRKQWGKRANTDNWRLGSTNKISREKTKEISDSIRQAEAQNRISAKKNKEKEKLDENDPNNKLGRAYYMAQLPFSEQQLKESNEKLKHALYMAGIIEMDDLENYYLAHKTLTRLYRDFPDFKPFDHLLYKLFLLELRWGSKDDADKYRNEIAKAFPENKYTAMITDPEFEEKARYGRAKEDSIYAATYNAFQNNDYETIERNCKISEDKYPHGANRSKFLFLESMNSLRKGDLRGFTVKLDSVSRYKDDKISEIATNILKGIKSGRKPVGGKYSMADLWESRRNLIGTPADSSHVDSLTTNKQEPYAFILSYSPKKVNEGKLLYNVSKFNFTTFAIRNFELSIAKNDTIHQLIVEGFENYGEIHQYALELSQDSSFLQTAKETQAFLISNSNLKLIGTKYTWEEYTLFYNKHFIPVSVRKKLDLDTIPGNFIWDEFEEVAPKEEKEEIIENDNSGEWY